MSESISPSQNFVAMPLPSNHVPPPLYRCHVRGPSRQLAASPRLGPERSRLWRPGQPCWQPAKNPDTAVIRRHRLCYRLGHGCRCLCRQSTGPTPAPCLHRHSEPRSSPGNSGNASLMLRRSGRRSWRGPPPAHMSVRLTGGCFISRYK